MPAPNPPTVNVDTQGAPALGPSDAPVTVVEFSDYECPACRATHEVVKQVRAAYGDKVQWIYKEYPLRSHKDAFKAAEASHCAQDQGKFWEYQEKLFTTPDLSRRPTWSIWPSSSECQRKVLPVPSGFKYKAVVDKNVQDAVEAGVDRTPSFMINGTVFAGGPSLDNFQGSN